MENKNISAVLDLLGSSLLQSPALPQVYLENLPWFLQKWGIRSMTTNDIDTISPLLNTASELGHLKPIFQQCSTIAFADWAQYITASDCWDVLLRDVIRPLKRKDMDFIFYLGNVSSSPVFKVDEALDIMSDYSIYGRTTLILDQQELKTLWQQLNGFPDSKSDDSWPFDYEKKFRFIFNTMKVHMLMVYSTNGVSLFSKDQQFNLTRQILPENIETSSHARTDFINGYTMGLTRKLDIPLCIALGIVYYAASGLYNTKPDRQALLDYIKIWKDQL
ncbi:MAG: hypothetical protein JST68_26105 [Bacteroidetes bacterium]|nr:hypothetical protein [Bacteroidota bacterium]